MPPDATAAGTKSQAWRRRLALLVEVALVAGLLTTGLSVRLRIVDTHWVYAGSDSYGYLKIGDEWRREHRFAFGPAPQPLEWYRRPLYPLFLLVARGDAPAEMSGGAGWTRIERAQLGLELLVMWPLLYLACRRVRGRIAALLALALATLFPPAVIFPLAALTESVAMTLTVVAIAPLLIWRIESRLAHVGSAVGVALAALLRPDGILLGVAFVPALFLTTQPWPARRRMLAVAAGAFLVVFAPWPIRNVVQFGSPHLSDGMIDRLGNDVPHYAGFWQWMKTWAQDEKGAGYPASCFYDNLCGGRMELYEPLGAFDAPATSSDDEHAKVERLLNERRRDGVTPSVSAGFDALARARRRAHPFRVLVDLPLRRTIRAWWAPQTELAQNSGGWPRFYRDLIPYFRTCGRTLYGATLLAIALLLIIPGSRIESLVLTAPLVARSLALGWTAFSIPRYVAPSYPLCYMLIGLAAAALMDEGWQRGRRALAMIRRR